MEYRLPLLLTLGALVLFWLAARQRNQLSLPSGALRYRDMSTVDRRRQALYDPVLDLVGRPDYVIEEGAQLIPVEVKSGRTPRKPYDSHIHQLAAYCLLIESEFGRRPSHGIIRYPEHNFRIAFTPQLEAQTRSLVAEMQAALEHLDLDRSHEHAARCQACGFLEICEQSL